jgi:hypothetical protein
MALDSDNILDESLASKYPWPEDTPNVPAHLDDIIDLTNDEDFSQQLQTLAESDKNQHEEDSFTPFVSIDPGWENYGYTIGCFRRICNPKAKDAKDRQIVEVCIVDKLCGTLSLFKGPTDDSLVLHRSLLSWIYRFLPYQLLPFTSVVIEKQYWNPKAAWASHRLLTIMHMLFAAFTERHAVVRLLDSKSYKTELGIAAGSHYQNKKASVEFARSLLPDDMIKSGHPFTDHESDTFCQAHYMFQYDWGPKMFSKKNEYGMDTLGDSSDIRVVYKSMTEDQFHDACSWALKIVN